MGVQPHTPSSGAPREPTVDALSGFLEVEKNERAQLDMRVRQQHVADRQVERIRQFLPSLWLVIASIDDGCLPSGTAADHVLIHREGRDRQRGHQCPLRLEDKRRSCRVEVRHRASHSAQHGGGRHRSSQTGPLLITSSSIICVPAADQRSPVCRVLSCGRRRKEAHEPRGKSGWCVNDVR